MPVISVSSHQIYRLSCALVIAAVAQACAPGNDPAPVDRAPESSEVEQAVAGGCGNTLTCQARSSCDPWSKFTQGDGLGFHTVSSQVVYWWFEWVLADAGGNSTFDEVNSCPWFRASTVESIIANTPVISSPAAQAFRYQNDPTVNPNASQIQYTYVYSDNPDCQNPFSQSCAHIYD
jgi:hypothetical protein